MGGRMPPMVRWLWRQVWATPQALAWERLGWTRNVARYCLVLLKAEQMDKAALAEARQPEDRLGLTPKAIRMLLWEIAPDEVGERPAALVSDLRERLCLAKAGTRCTRRSGCWSVSSPRRRRQLAGAAGACRD
jgi:hypothetical protein